MRRYYVQQRDDYVYYNKLRGMITKMANELSLLPSTDVWRQKMARRLLNKCVAAALLPFARDLSQCESVTVSAFCRRRLATVLVRLKMAETMREAVTFIEQGHIRIGTMVVRDPAYYITREMEERVTWTDTSKIKRKILEYTGQLDDYDLMN